MQWREQQRGYLKRRENELKPNELLLQLDYGGFTDSRNSKVNCWSATAVLPAKSGKPHDVEHFDFLFDAANQNQTEGKPGAKKNGQSGIFFLGELLDPTRGSNGVSLLGSRCPDATHLILSGDTGNGYRAYEMLEELSTVFAKFGFTVDTEILKYQQQ